ncbi:MAG: outer membrane beta-barrel protein [Burkholderiales bacterium]
MKKTLLLAATLAAASSACVAQSAPRWYLGLGIGRASIAQDYSGSILAVPGATASDVVVNSSDTAARLFTGFKITPYIGLEAGFQSFGKFGARNTVTAPAGVAGTYDSTWKVSGVHLDLIATLPLTDFMSLSGKAGVIRARTNVDSTAPGVTSSTSGDKFALRYGAAFQIDFSRWLAFRADAEINKDATKGSLVGIGDTPLDYRVLTGNILFKF